MEVEPHAFPRLAQEIVEDELRTRVVGTDALAGGDVNAVFRVQARDVSVIARLNIAENLARFHKEAWCIAAAKAAGVPTASVVAIGERNGIAFLLLEDLGPRHATEAADTEVVWRALGEHLRLVHTIRTEGFGDKMVSAGVFDGDWEQFLEDNLYALASPQQFADVLTSGEASRLHERASVLRDVDLHFGLAHGDVSLKNALISGDVVSLVDWGSAEAHIVPHYDLIETLKSSFELDASSSNFRALLGGYGIDDRRNSLMPELHALLVVKAANKLRWGRDRAPHRVNRYRAFLREVSEHVLDQGSV